MSYIRPYSSGVFIGTDAIVWLPSATGQRDGCATGQHEGWWDKWTPGDKTVICEGCLIS